MPASRQLAGRFYEPGVDAVKRYDLFERGTPTALTGEWRHVGNFPAPNAIAARGVALAYLRRTGAERVRIFTGNLNSTVGRMVDDIVRRPAP